MLSIKKATMTVEAVIPWGAARSIVISAAKNANARAKTRALY